MYLQSRQTVPAVGDEVILVDEQDRAIGTAAKMAAHQNGGQLHRAFSIFIFNSRGQMLLQQRSARKYHFGGLWSNACCSHPHPGSSLEEVARRRLREEFGFTTELRRVFSFIYKAADARTGLTENEFDHVFFGHFHGQPMPNPDEIDDWKWIPVPDLIADMQHNPEAYTPWFRVALPKVLAGDAGWRIEDRE